MSVFPAALMGLSLMLSQPARAADGDFAPGAVARIPAEPDTRWLTVATGDGYLVLLLEDGELLTARVRPDGALLDSEPQRVMTVGTDVSLVVAAPRGGRVLVAWATDSGPWEPNVVKVALLDSDGRRLAGPQVLQTFPYPCRSVRVAANQAAWAVAWYGSDSEHHESGTFGAIFGELDDADPALLAPQMSGDSRCVPYVLAGNPGGFLLGNVAEGSCGNYILDADGTVRAVGRGGFSVYTTRGQPVWTGSRFAYPREHEGDVSVVFIDSHARQLGELRPVMSYYADGSAVVFDGRYVVIAVSTGFRGHLSLALFGADGTTLHPQMHSSAAVAQSSDIGWSNRPRVASNGDGDVLLAFQLRDGTIELLIPNRGDGVPDDVDNCLVVQNPAQADVDGDGVGDECDDDDGDYFPEVFDNCPGLANPDQPDRDLDGEGDACDPDFDYDGDGWFTLEDNCPRSVNPDQLDFDGDGAGDVCDSDDDSDGIEDRTDNCPWVPNADQADSDADGVGDACTPPPSDPPAPTDRHRLEDRGERGGWACSVASVASPRHATPIALFWTFATVTWALRRRTRKEPCRTDSR